MDCFAFYSSICNEELFADTKLHRRTSVAHVVTWRLFNYKRHDGIDPHTLLDYFSGFSTINNRCPFESDIWEGTGRQGQDLDQAQGEHDPRRVARELRGVD